MEFEHYLIRTHALRKSFLSIKGIYYQATIQGQDILWLVPYRFVQRAGPDVDFRIMGTFVQFYTTLLGFVNFRLYTSIGLVYPPTFDAASEEKGAELGAIQIEGRDMNEVPDADGTAAPESNETAQAEADKLLTLSEHESQPEDPSNGIEEATGENAEDNTTLDQFASVDPNADTLLQPSATADATIAGQLFEPFTFFLSRETPRHPLEFILKAFGCKRVGWDSSLGDPGAYCSEDDPRITHQIVDRPDLPLPSPPATDGEQDEEDTALSKRNERVPGRIYVQPQWVWDSINAGQLQRPDLYAPGATLPPHLSPWVKATKGEYDPTVPLVEQETLEEAELDDEEDVDDEHEIDQGSEGEEVDGVRGDEEARDMEEDLDDEEDGGMNVELAASDDGSEEDENVNDKAAYDEWGGFSGDEAEIDNEEVAAREAQADLEAEALGQMPSQPASKQKQAKEAAQAKRSRAGREAQEDIERRKMMMPRRKRKVYEKMIYSNARKDEEAERLRAKRRKIEKEAVNKR